MGGIYEVMLFEIFLLLVVLLSKKDSYCMRDEVVNEQFLVEEIYDRELALAKKLEKEDSDGYLHVILSTERGRTSSRTLIYGTY